MATFFHEIFWNFNFHSPKCLPFFRNILRSERCKNYGNRIVVETCWTWVFTTSKYFTSSIFYFQNRRRYSRERVSETLEANVFISKIYFNSFLSSSAIRQFSSSAVRRIGALLSGSRGARSCISSLQADASQKRFFAVFRLDSTQVHGAAHPSLRRPDPRRRGERPQADSLKVPS